MRRVREDLGVGGDEGPHLLLQMRAAEGWGEIGGWLEELERTPEGSAHEARVTRS